jgi:hypothetical protein
MDSNISGSKVNQKMRDLLKIRLSKKFGIDPENAVLQREVDWFMAQRDRG